MSPIPEFVSISLAQTSGPNNLGSYLLWVGIFLVLVIGAGLAILAYRKAMLSSGAADQHGGILDSLRRLRDSGQMTGAEYDAARKSIAAKVAASAPPPAKPKPPLVGPNAAGTPPGSLIARPGFDLTGAPLPKPPTNPSNGA